MVYTLMTENMEQEQLDEFNARLVEGSNQAREDERRARRALAYAHGKVVTVSAAR